MPKRGKAATRQARQRRAQMRAAGAVTARPQVADARVDEPASVAAADRIAGTRADAGVTRSRSDRLWHPEASSRLSDRALADYHYVARDLRNIAYAAGLMAAVLLAVFIVVRVVGIGPG